jgi:hypothetical protein
MPRTKKTNNTVVKATTTRKATSKRTTTRRATTANKSPKGVQAHGKKWENEIISLVVSPSKIEEAMNQPYTAVHDIPKHLNKITGRNVSIKATGKNAVDFGDAIRVIDNLEKDSPLEAIVINYKQSGDLKVPTSVVRVDLTQSKDVLLGKNIDKFTERIKVLDKMLKTKDPKYKAYSAALQKDMKKDGAYLSLRPKVANPKKNRPGRLQISLTNMSKLIEDHPELVLENNGCDIYGKNCLSTLESKRRVLNKKTKQAALSVIDELDEMDEDQEEL